MIRLDRQTAIERIGLIVILAAFAALSVWYGMVTPLFEGPDEAAHFQYVKYLADGKGLPRLGQGPRGVLWEGLQQPPLYYALSAGLTASAGTDTSDLSQLLWTNPHRGGETGGQNLYYHTDREAFPYHGAALAAHLLRWFNTLFGLTTVMATYAAAREVFAGRSMLALGAAAVIAFNPQFIATSGLVTNDVALAAFCSVGTWLLLRTLRRETLPVRDALVLGLMAALAAATKASGLAFVGWCGLGVAVISWRRRSLRSLWTGWLAVAAPAVIVAGWWYVRQWMLYGSVFPHEAMVAIQAETIRPEAIPLSEAIAYSAWLQKSFWGVFGNGVLMDFPVYAALEWVMRLGLAGLALLAVRWWFDASSFRRGSPVWLSSGDGAGVRGLGSHTGLPPRNDDVMAWGLALLAAWGLVVYAALLRFMQTVDATNQGRLLFPAATALSILLLAGWTGFVPRRWAPVPAALLGGGLLALAVAAPLQYIGPAYAQPAGDARLSHPTPAVGTPVRFGDGIELIGYQIVPIEVRAGSPVHVTLEWRCLAPMTQSYKLFVHLLGYDGERLTQIDTIPYNGRFATVLWKPGQEFRDEYDLFVTGKAKHSLGRIQIGFFPYDDPAKRLPTFAPDGKLLSDHFELSAFKIAPKKVKNPDVQRPLDAGFGDSFALRGYDVKPEHLRPGETLTLTLYWEETAKVERDYTVFVHVLNEKGELIVQQDQAPLNGNYPTSVWSTGEGIVDERALVLPADLLPGEYRLAVGLYAPETGERLRARLNGQDVADGRAIVGAVEVQAATP
jgi:4-amino-4-deoxy-L-arabinose transferase-like glycosyltransferase